mmetsp:Transcript_112281/g.194659  ORF Transcript_112281/g.194659 Transcript_112281/m.194659 type:complete len:303 (+) Transcript_112281:899-1807(+)
MTHGPPQPKPLILPRPIPVAIRTCSKLIPLLHQGPIPLDAPILDLEILFCCAPPLPLDAVYCAHPPLSLVAASFAHPLLLAAFCSDPPHFDDANCAPPLLSDAGLPVSPPHSARAAPPPPALDSSRSGNPPEIQWSQSQSVPQATRQQVLSGKSVPLQVPALVQSKWRRRSQALQHQPTSWRPFLRQLQGAAASWRCPDAARYLHALSGQNPGAADARPSLPKTVFQRSAAGVGQASKISARRLGKPLTARADVPRRRGTRSLQKGSPSKTSWSKDSDNTPRPTRHPREARSTPPLSFPPVG